MEISVVLSSLYFAICFSIVGLVSSLLVGINFWRALRRYSMWRFSKWGVVNYLWLILLVPCAITSSIVAVIFWDGVF